MALRNRKCVVLSRLKLCGINTSSLCFYCHLHQLSTPVPECPTRSSPWPHGFSGAHGGVYHPKNPIKTGTLGLRKMAAPCQYSDKARTRRSAIGLDSHQDSFTKYHKILSTNEHRLTAMQHIARLTHEIAQRLNIYD